MASNVATKASQEDWHPADIKAALEKKGWTLMSLARHHGLTSGTSMSHVFDRSYPANERRIAEAIGVPPQLIWPSRYFEDGSMRPRGRRLKQSRAAQSTALRCQDNGNRSDAD